MVRPTLVDVARAAGVSRATAARVLAGATNVDAAMTIAVEREAARLGYETNQAARILRGGRAGAIGLVIALYEIDSLSGTFFAAVLKGAAKGLTESEVQPVLLPADHEDRDRIPRFLRSGAVDGAIVILQHEIVHLAESLVSAPVPIAWVGRPRIQLPAETIVVDSDNHGGGVLAAQALLSAGRRRLGIITGPPDMLPARERTRGWKDELSRHGVAPGAIVNGDFTIRGGTAAMARLLQRMPEIDGLFASSDFMAIGAMEVLQASGRRVPDDVAVVGFDDIVFSATASVPLTTVRQPLEEMGRVAAETLIASTKGAAVEYEHILPTTLVMRETL